MFDKYKIYNFKDDFLNKNYRLRLVDIEYGKLYGVIPAIVYHFEPFDTYLDYTFKITACKVTHKTFSYTYRSFTQHKSIDIRKISLSDKGKLYYSDINGMENNVKLLDLIVSNINNDYPELVYV
jgi:hypothetical protein